jgi:hypothetical protein
MPWQIGQLGINRISFSAWERRKKLVHRDLGLEFAGFFQESVLFKPGRQLAGSGTKIFSRFDQSFFKADYVLSPMSAFGHSLLPNNPSSDFFRRWLSRNCEMELSFQGSVGRENGRTTWTDALIATAV